MTFMFQPSSRFNLAASLVVVGVALVTLSQPVLAQVTQNNIPAQANPGLIVRPEEDKTYSDKTQDKQKQLPSEVDKVDIEVPDQQKADDMGGDATRFEVTRINLEGNTVFTTEELQPILAKYEGKKLSLEDLGKAVDEINQKYRDKGYLTSQAYVPPQDIENGIVKIQVVEGTIGDVEISGNKYFRTWAIERTLHYEPGDKLNIKELESTLNRMNQQQQFRLKAILKAGDKTGETDVTFQVAERQPWQISPTFDNQGRPFVGMYRWGVEIQNQNLLGMGDRLTLKWLMAEGRGNALTQVGAASYFVPINKYGTEVGYSYSFSYVDVDLNGNANQDRIEGFANNHSLVISQPLDSERVFTVDAAFNARRVRTLLAGEEITDTAATATAQSQNNGQVDVRSISFGLNMNKLEKFGRTFVRFQTDVAPKWWLGSDAAFWKASLFGTQLVRLPYSSLLILRGSAQFTPDALPSIEQYQLGGAFSVRGYTEGRLIGDRGYNLSAEVRTPIPGLKQVSPWLNERLQVAGFVDMGQIWIDSSNPNRIIPGRQGNSTSGESPFLMGVGVGLRGRLTRFMIGFVDFGFGLNDETIEAQGTRTNSQGTVGQPTMRVHFGLRSDLLPDTLKTHEEKAAKKVKTAANSKNSKKQQTASVAKPAAKVEPVKNTEQPVKKPQRQAKLKPQPTPPLQLPEQSETSAQLEQDQETIQRQQLESVIKNLSLSKAD